MKALPYPIVELNDNGAWSWFMDERVVVHQGKLLVGSIRSTGQSYRAGMAEPHWGNCELAVHDLASKHTEVVVLHEHFKGVTQDGGATWRWSPVTQNSTEDNLRPIIPIWDDPRVALVWMRGKYHHNQGPWSTRVVALVQER